jgi:hypothetical protein
MASHASLHRLVALKETCEQEILEVLRKIEHSASKEEKDKLTTEKRGLEDDLWDTKRDIFRTEQELEVDPGPSNEVPLNCEECSIGCGYCGKCVYRRDQDFDAYEFY